METPKNFATGIKGHRCGGDPEDEADNYCVCSSCGQAVDMRDLGQVFHHEETGHKPLKIDD